MISERTADRVLEANRGFERLRDRVWLERVRVGLEYRRGMREIEDGIVQAKLERDRAIRDAVEAGGSYREVARAAGLSHSRVQQIVNEGKAARVPA
jgi:DNA invertase Pin-like site-specific DNA recombinase